MWCGLTHLRELRAHPLQHLPQFRDEAGTELFGLPHAPRPPEATPALARLLAAFDNLLLSRADRRRVMTAPAQEHLLGIRNGILSNMFLLDGFVAGTWTLELRRGAAQLTSEPFGTLTTADRTELTAEAERLLHLAAEGAGQANVVFVTPGSQSIGQQWCLLLTARSE